MAKRRQIEQVTPLENKRKKDKIYNLNLKNLNAMAKNVYRLRPADDYIVTEGLWWEE